MKNGGRIPWNVTAFCETFKISCLMGRHLMKGCLVEYHPISAKDISRLHRFGRKVLPDIFLGYAVHAGGIWKGDIMVADFEELEEMDASELHAKRLNAKEVLTPMNGEHF